MADTDLDPPAPPFAARGGTSIRSFKLRDRGTGSSPPSIGGDSTRRRAFGMSSLLGRRAKRDPTTELDPTAVSKKLVAVELCTSENMDPGKRPAPPSRRVTEPVPPQAQPPQKSRTIFRKLTTKFNRNRSPSPPAINRRRSLAIPQVDNSATLAAREARNAALRERGLLPQLPLSEQEAQQDSRIAIVKSPEPLEPSEPASGLTRRPTEANRIKEEWEAKNRMAGFRFGGNSPTASPVQGSFPALNTLGAVEEAETPLPSPLPSPEVREEEPSPPEPAAARPDSPGAKVPRAPPPTLNLSRGRNLSPPLLQAWSDTTPPDADLPPLPDSPAPATESAFSSLISAFATTPAADAAFTPVSPAFLPLPPSPSSPSASHSTFSAFDPNATPRPPGSPTSATSLSPTRARDASLPRTVVSESGESSLGVPSLLQDSASQSTVSTSDSLALANPPVGRMRNVKVRNSTIEGEPGAHRAIEVIVESPGEERVDPFANAGTSFVRMESPEPVKENDALTEEEREEIPEARPAPISTLATSTGTVTPRRRDTTSDGGSGKRKSLMMSIRRSLGGGGGRKSTGGAPAGFNATLLPPSPTLPDEFKSQQQRGPSSPAASPVARSRTVTPYTQNRASVFPTMHSTGSIVAATSEIGDEETRRMTELAFM